MAVLASVAVVGGMVAAVAGTPAPAAAPSSADGIAVAPAGCLLLLGLLHRGHGDGGQRHHLPDELDPAPVSGVMTTVSPAPSGGAVPTVHRTVTVPALGTLTVDPAVGLPAGSNASLVSFAGGGVVASQVVSGANGWSTAPCASRIVVAVGVRRRVHDGRQHPDPVPAQPGRHRGCGQRLLPDREAAW